MQSLLRVVLVASLALGAACRPSIGPISAAAVLLERDRAWARTAEKGNLDSIVAYWADDARVILPDQPILVGKQAVRTMVAGSLAIPGFRITWSPDSAVVSSTGDLGYTYGTNRVTAPDAAGHLTTTEGRYVTAWRKEPDGRWRCTVDIYNVGPAAAAVH